MGLIIGFVVLLLAMALPEIIFGGGDSKRPSSTVCPYCGSDDTDGNHCSTCDEDF